MIGRSNYGSLRWHLQRAHILTKMPASFHPWMRRWKFHRPSQEKYLRNYIARLREHADGLQEWLDKEPKNEGDE